MAELYPQAPIFTLLYDELGTGGRFAGRRSPPRPCSASVSAIEFQAAAAALPDRGRASAAPASDVVISSSSAFAHGVRAPEGAIHICYCYTPFRYAWYEEDVRPG